MLNENELETAIAESEQNQTEHQILTPYYGKETVERMMTGMMQEMRQGTERAWRQRMQGTVDAMLGMGYDNNEIIEQLISSYGISREEAEGFIPSVRLSNENGI